MNSGLVDEHAPRGQSAKGEAVYEPTDAERKAIKLVERVYERNKKHRSLYDQKWLDYYHFFRGKQWKDNRPSYRHAEVINFVFRTIQSLVPIQMDARPKTDFLPEEPGDFELSELLREMNDADWQKNNWTMEQLEVLYDANITGTGISELCIDEQLARKGIHKVVYKSIDPFFCFPDPDARDVNKECCSWVTAVPTDIAKVKRLYPDKKEYLKPDLIDLMRSQKGDISPVKVRSPVDRGFIADGSAHQLDGVDKDKALLVTAWLSPEFCEDDYEEIEKVVDRDPVSGEEVKEYEQHAKYPNGRKIVICNGVLLEDSENPYDDGRIPYQRLLNYVLPREFWGLSEVEQLEGPQKIFNKVFSFALDVLTLMGNPVWIVDQESGVDPETITNRPGLVVEKTSAGEVRREEGVQLQPYVMQLADKVAEWIDSMAGSQDVSRGAQPTGVTAASAINALQEASHTRIRLKSKLMDAYLQDVGQAWLSRVFQFRTAPEVYRLTNQEGATKYFRAYIENVEKPDGSKGRMVHMQPYSQDETGRQTGQYDPTQEQVYEQRGDFDVKVSTGSSLPFNKAEKEGKLLKFFELGIIDEEEVLKGAEYPNYQSVLARMAQKKADQMAAEAAAKGAPPAPMPAA
jgi:hypothetical protein